MYVCMYVCSLEGCTASPCCLLQTPRRHYTGWGRTCQRAEIPDRCSLHAFNKHKKLVFGSPVVGASEKATLFASLVESTLYYGSGTWSNLKPAEVDKMQGCLLRMARQMLRPRFKYEAACHLSGKYVLAVARIASAETALHVERLRHLKAVVLRATDQLWAILHYEQGWLELAQQSLQWFRKMHGLSGSMLPCWESWEGVVAFIRGSPNRWKKAVTKAKSTAVLAELWTAECQQYCGLVYRALTKHGAFVPTEISQRHATTEICALCGIVFTDLRAWSHHAFKRHGRLNPVRLLATGSQCPVCLKQFKANKGFVTTSHTLHHVGMP